MKILFYCATLGIIMGFSLMATVKNTLVENNVSSGNKAFVSDGKPQYPDFNTEKLGLFLRK